VLAHVNDALANWPVRARARGPVPWCVRARARGPRPVRHLGSRHSGVRPEALGAPGSPVCAHASCWVTNRVIIGARWLLTGPAVPFQSTTGCRAARRVTSATDDPP